MGENTLFTALVKKNLQAIWAAFGISNEKMAEEPSGLMCLHSECERITNIAKIERIVGELTAWEDGDAHTLARWLHAKGVRAGEIAT